MKKLLFLATIVLFIWSCRSVDCFKDYQYKNQSPGITLNGIDETSAKAAHDNFLNLRDQDIRPTRESIWFDKVTFHKMVTLLIKEKGGPETLSKPDVVDKTDGIRIYFASSSALKFDHMVTSIIIVSTKNEGPEDPQYPDGYQYHRDYYNHSLQDPLFNHLDSIKGKVEIRPFLNIYQGQDLYNIRIAKNDTSSSKIPHYISRNKGHEMANYFGKDPVSSKSEWFDLKLLATLDSVSKGGVRIYFARHKALSVDNKPDTDALKEGFILLPTISKGSHQKDSFISNQLDSYIRKAAVQKAKTKTTSHNMLISLADTTGGFDNGEICPTHCNSN